ncbi:unnamed protein product [Schistocephalus solidus]|uniref:Fibronectin type-III domain-containing protein n=1 Tax=Schistocephalus solidus TaxID=70667 RepID=A0A183SA79_SCHSO|nr:unnamed protein product [Schistocephalus solidus]
MYNFYIAVETILSEDCPGGGMGNYTSISYRTCSGLGRPVQNLTVIPLHREAAIYWKVPQPTFGEIEKYLVELKDTRASIFNREYSPNIKLPLVIPNLMPGEQYTVSVVTVNKADCICAGSGGPSLPARKTFSTPKRGESTISTEASPMHMPVTAPDNTSNSTPRLRRHGNQFTQFRVEQQPENPQVINPVSISSSSSSSSSSSAFSSTSSSAFSSTYSSSSILLLIIATSEISLA